MADPVVIISGASRGVGRATAVELAGRGCGVALIARNAEELSATADLCNRAGGRVLTVAGDITDEPTLGRLVQEAVDRFGRIDGVVNNAGLAPQAGVAETDAELFRRVIDVNLTAAMTLTRLAWPHLLRQGGCVVNVSSMAAIDPRPGFVAYSAAKAGLIGLTRALAREGDAHGVRSVAIVLGGVETTMFRGLSGVDHVPTQDLLTPDEVGRVIAECVAGPLAYSSGQSIFLRKRV